MSRIRTCGEPRFPAKGVHTCIKHQQANVVGVPAEIVIVRIKPKPGIMHRVNARIGFIQLSITQ